MTAESGNLGPDIRSDCHIRVETTTSKGIRVDLVSRVESLYGRSIRELIHTGARELGLTNALITVEDSGALPFVIMARLEAAVKQVLPSQKELLPAMNPSCVYPAVRDRFRFSRLYLPGNNPKMMLNAGIHQPHGIILDLEDSVAPDRKTEARILVRNALRSVDFFGAERMVRINQLPAGLDDLKALVPQNIHLVLIPKCETPEQVREVEAEVKALQKVHKLSSGIYFMPIIESALGVENAFLVATASAGVVAMAIGLEDYTADLGVTRTSGANESFYARTRVVNACKAAGIQAIDSVFSDVGDEEGLTRAIDISRSLGFEGMGCIHPRQIAPIHAGYAPVPGEIDKAKKIVLAFLEAAEKGLGVVALGTKMIDPPVVKRAQRTIDLALKLGLLPENWRNEDEK